MKGKKRAAAYVPGIIENYDPLSSIKKQRNLPENESKLHLFLPDSTISLNVNDDSVISPVGVDEIHRNNNIVPPVSSAIKISQSIAAFYGTKSNSVDNIDSASKANENAAFKEDENHDDDNFIAAFNDGLTF